MLELTFVIVIQVAARKDEGVFMDARGAAPVWVGLDLGTQGVRAVAVTDDGESVATATRPLTRDHRVAERHEQDPLEWWTAVCAVLSSLTATLEGTPVQALAISSTSGTLLTCDTDGAPLGSALMYDDTRAGDEAARVQDAGALLWARLGYRVQPSWALPKVAWLQRTGALTPGVHVQHQADHIAGRLVGHRTATDTSHALKTGYDLLERRWPSSVLEAIGVPEQVLPDVVLPGEVLGTVCAAAGELTGLAAGTPVRAGMTDGCAAQVATGALSPGSWSSALGTTLVVKGATAELLTDPSGAVYSHLNPDGGWLPGGASSTGAGVVATAFPGADLDELTRRAAAHDPAPGTTYPLTGHGERFPFVAPQARGFSTMVSDDDAVRFAGVLQGVALLERLCFDVLRGLGADTSGPVFLSGGATRNFWWNQLRADVLRRETRLCASVEAAVGAAVLAAAPPGELATTAARMVRTVRTYFPDPGRGDRYAEPYDNLVATLTDRGWLSAHLVAA